MLDAVANIFEVLKSHINEGNHKEAAIDLVHTLVDTQGEIGRASCRERV